ncbi:MAG: glycosyltransferase N-terminal domain-containing protein [Candidatus Babeliales bacterium]
MKYLLKFLKNLQIILIFLFYQIIQVIILPIIIIYLFVRWIKKKSIFGSFKERIGIVPKTPKSKKIIWLHAVSVGEVLSIQNLIKQIKTEIPNSFCYITTGTITGKNMAQKNLQFADKISFMPFDFLFPMLFAYKRIKPNAIIIIEAEIWPNFIILSNFFKTPIYLLNARISQRSKKKYFFLKFLFKPLFNIFETIFAQSIQDQKIFIKLGVEKNKINILGNIKALNVLEKKNFLQNNLKNNQNFSKFNILLAGSIHEWELDVYLDLFKNLNKYFENLKLILAPRHFDWQNNLEKKVKNFGFKYFLWDNKTQINSQNYYQEIKNILLNHDILLVCKFGELFNLYQICTIFFLGGTFVSVGGHNLLEPAAWGKISIIGPYYQNCKDNADNLELANALIKVKNSQKLLSNTQNLLENKEKINLMEQNAQNWLMKEANFVRKNLEFLIKQIY